MKIICRTVTGAATEFEIEPSGTIRSLKERLSSDYELSSLRLCHKGKVLDDLKTMEDLGFKDGEVLIIAGKKAKAQQPAPAPAAAPAAPAPVAPAPTESTPASAPAQEQPTAPQQPPAEPTPAAPTPAAPPASDNALPPGVDASTVEAVMSMGFDDRAKVIHALRCAFGNADRAVEYLFSGIPAGIEAQFRQQAAAPPPPSAPVTATTAATTPASGSAGGGSGGAGMTAEQLGQMMADMQQRQQGGSELQRALSRIPQFQQIRALVRQNSAALPTVMQQLQEHHPDVFQLVQANPQEFLELINSSEGAPAGGAAGASAEGAEEEVPRLTAADQPAIERLVALGGGQWDARAAAIVFLACRRNEELAANVLFDNGGLPPELVQALQEGAMQGGGAGEADSDEEA